VFHRSIDELTSLTMRSRKSIYRNGLRVVRLTTVTEFDVAGSVANDKLIAVKNSEAVSCVFDRLPDATLLAFSPLES